jgi:hypothetical protein
LEASGQPDVAPIPALPAKACINPILTRMATHDNDSLRTGKDRVVGRAGQDMTADVK